MNYSIHNEKTVFNDHYKVVQAEVVYDTFDGNKITARRLAFERGDSVAILLLEKETKTILLTYQFRYPSCKHNQGWLVEIPAGTLEEHENPEECIKREVLEELGYEIGTPELISEFYTSPGASTERIFLFFHEVSTQDKIRKGGGAKAENEDIQSVKLPVDEIAFKLSQLEDAKTILALQWYLLNKV